MPQEASNIKPAKRQSRQLPLWKKSLFASLVCIALFAFLELTLWVCGVSTQIEGEDPFQGFSGLISVFDTDGDEYRTRPGNRSSFNDQSFLRQKPANGFRIFGLGGSSAHGFPWGAETALTGIVGEAVAAGHPDLQVEAVNASAVSYAMHRLNIVADELIAYDADVFIIYSGHNEFAEPAFFEALKRRSSTRTRLEYALAHSRVYSGMRSAMLALSAEDPSRGQEFGTSVQRDFTRVYAADEKEKIVDEFRFRLERLVRRAQEADVKVVLSTVPANLRQWRPEASEGIASLSETDRQDWSDAYAAGKRQLQAGNVVAANASFLQAANLAPRHAETQFLLAQSYEGLTKWDQARAAYQFACDYDASPIRRISSINQVIREVAKEKGALLVDMDQIFEQLSEHGLVGFNLIEDYVHPTREGHEIIAWHIWNAMEKAGMMGSEAADREQVFAEIKQARRRRPVTNTTNAVWLYNQGVVLNSQGNAKAAIEKYREALALDANYKGALLNLGMLLFEAGESAESAELLQRLLGLDPDNADAHNNLGSALWGLARYKEAIQHYQDALRIKPDFAEAHYNLGNAMLETGRAQDSLPHYAEVIRIQPDFADAQYAWGNALQILGRLDAAVPHYQNAVRIRPDFAEAHNNWGVLLLGQRKAQEASQHFQRAVSIKPDYADAQENLRKARMLMQRQKQKRPN